MTITLHRPICDLLGCIYPIVLAGMGSVARGERVSVVAPAVRADVEAFRRQVAELPTPNSSGVLS
jgi:nitronate monooxygenase